MAKIFQKLRIKWIFELTVFELSGPDLYLLDDLVAQGTWDGDGGHEHENYGGDDPGSLQGDQTLSSRRVAHQYIPADRKMEDINKLRKEGWSTYVYYVRLPNANKAAHCGFETQRKRHKKSKTGVPVALKMDMCSPKNLF